LLEDPAGINHIGTELQLESTKLGMLTRGIIDRLDTDGQGNLTVVDYKSGKAPGKNYEQDKLSGVNFYAMLCDHTFGVLPTKVRLLYLDSPLEISTTPSVQKVRGVQKQIQAMWKTIVKSCETDNFRPKTSFMCNFCSYKPICPAWQID
jgi:putative RecB family exonuclease